MGIAVLGPLQVDGGTGTLARRDRVVLAVLAIRTGDLVSADQLAEALWGDSPPATWNKALQGTVVRLRRLLGGSTIETVDQGYRLDGAHATWTPTRFERLVGRARELVTLGEPERAAYVAGRGAGAVAGPPLADLEDWEPGRTEADRLEELRLDAEELQVDAALRSRPSPRGAGRRPGAWSSGAAAGAAVGAAGPGAVPFRPAGRRAAHAAPAAPGARRRAGRGPGPGPRSPSSRRSCARTRRCSPRSR